MIAGLADLMTALNNTAYAVVGSGEAPRGHLALSFFRPIHPWLFPLLFGWVVQLGRLL